MDAKVLTLGKLEDWLEHCRRDGVPLQWFGKAAESMGLYDEAEPAKVLHVIGDVLALDADQIADFLHRFGLSADGTTSSLSPPVAYHVEFRPHETVLRLAADPQSRAGVLKAHEWAVGAARKELEEALGLGLVGVEVTSHHEPTSEVIFSVTGRYSDHRGRWWIGSENDFLYKVRPGGWVALNEYHQRLGNYLTRWCTVEVEYESWRETAVSAAVVKS